MDFTGLGDFTIHTVSLLITDSLINPQSDDGKRTSFPCYVVTMFADCLATVDSQAALLPEKQLPSNSRCTGCLVA
jgi:hypothetical protein